MASDLTCQSCDIDFQSHAKLFLDHMSIEHNNNEVCCNVCYRPFLNGANFADHFLATHHNQQNVANGLSEELSCPMCHYKTEDATDLVAHVCSMHEDTMLSASAFDRVSSVKETELPKSHMPTLQLDDSASEAGQIAGTGAESEWKPCPVCNSLHRDDAELTAHVNYHFGDDLPDLHIEADAEPSTSKVFSCFDANASTSYAERNSFEELQKRYGMDEKGSGFVDSGKKVLDRRYANGAMNLDQYYAGKRELHMQAQGIENPHWGIPDGPVHIPSVPKIQELIEKAWKSGFDPVGCEQLNGKLVKTRKWIGTTEVAAFLSSFNIRIEIVDFTKPSGANGTHPTLFRWVWDHFKNRTENDLVTPLYLQHEGHSRTIIGIDKFAGNNYRLYVLDPTQKPEMVRQVVEVVKTEALKFLRRTEGQMKSRQYQILRVKGVFETAADQQRVKGGFELTKL